MASLVDIARAMDKERASNEPKQLVATLPAKPELSLVDIAHEQHATKPTTTAKPPTLVDVARKSETSSRVAMTAATATSLQNLAQEINAEERARLDSAITKAATEVKQDTAHQRASVLKAAASEVLQDEEEETREASLPLKKQSPVDQLASARIPSKAPPSPLSDHDGYSSFEEENVESTKKNTNASSTKKKTSKTSSTDDENQSEAGGPEKTTASESLLAKAFLRAIYRGDTRRVRDMIRDEDVNASTADQHGWSALHWAASQGQGEILSMLLETQARVDTVEHVNGWTALHLAVMRDSVACAKKLLYAGAKTTIPDLYGDTVYDLLKVVKGKKKERWLQLLLLASKR